MEEHPHSDVRIDMAQFAGYCLSYNERVFCLCVCHNTDLQAVDQFVSCFHRHLLVILDNALYE